MYGWGPKEMQFSGGFFFGIISINRRRWKFTNWGHNKDYGCEEQGLVALNTACCFSCFVHDH